jgi:predicted ester cyclase/heme-degrading monooxygenase HmoA
MKAAHTGLYLVLAILHITGISNAQVNKKINESTKNKEGKMTTEQTNKEVIRNLYEESMNKGKIELLGNFVSGEYVGARGGKGVAAFREPVTSVLNAMPDAQWQIQELVSEGDKVVVRWKLKGTHTGAFQHISPTGNTVSNDGMAIFQMKDGKIIGSQVHTDRLGFLQQLEALPLDLTTLSKKSVDPGSVRFIDKFLVPEKAKQEFMERMNFSRNFIKTLPGFIEDAAYESKDGNGNYSIVTIAVWKNEEALQQAKESMQAEYKKQGFNPSELLQRLNIIMERGIYEEVIKK